jgi:hypothetical protein
MALLTMALLPDRAAAHPIVCGTGPYFGLPYGALTFEYYSRRGPFIRYGYPVLGPTGDRFYGFGPRYTVLGSQSVFIGVWPYFSYASYPAFPQVTVYQPVPFFQPVPVYQPVPVPQFVPMMGGQFDAARNAALAGHIPIPQLNQPNQAAQKPAVNPFNKNANEQPVAVLPPPVPQPRPPLKELLPPLELRRLLDGGDDAFGEGSYNDAKRWYTQAVAARPQEPSAHFRLAQALFALGEFDEAARSIAAGLELQPDWPKSAFRPRDLYRARPGDYARHLGRLADALAAAPDDQRLLFLLGHQLWFSGKKDEAAVYFRQAQNQAANFQAVKPFLQARAR